MADVTTTKKIIERGGWAALGQKVGYMEVTVSLVSGSSAHDLVYLFGLEADTLILAVGSEIITAAANAVTASVGTLTDHGTPGNCTTLMGETIDCDGAVGAQSCGGQGLANVLLAADETIVLELSGDPGAGGSVRIWAVVADIGQVSGL